MKTKNRIKPYDNIHLEHSLSVCALKCWQSFWSISLYKHGSPWLAALNGTVSSEIHNSVSLTNCKLKSFLQKNICLASPGLCSIGQYGHFNLKTRKNTLNQGTGSVMSIQYHLIIKCL